MYAPVDNWDALLTADALDQLGPQAVTLRCDRLSVAEMAIPFRGPQWFEMEADGNTVVESSTFTALGERITYDGRKDLLILSGEGRDAESVPPDASRRRARSHRHEDHLLLPQNQQDGDAQRGTDVAIYFAPGRQSEIRAVAVGYASA